MGSIPNPLRSTTIPLELLSENSKVEEYDGTSPTAPKPFAYITTKKHPTLPLCMHNYNPRSFWSSSPLSWSFGGNSEQQHIIDSESVTGEDERSLAITLASRSLVTEDGTGRVLSRSFSKFFNYEERMAYQPTGREYAYEIYEKVDGSIISLFWYEPTTTTTTTTTTTSKGQWVVASRTTFGTQHTEAAWGILNARYSSLISEDSLLLDRTKTYVFELVDRRLPIKIRYPYDSDLVLLSIVSRDGSERRRGEREGDDMISAANGLLLPFRRPRKWSLSELIPGEEEGPAGGGGAVTSSILKRLSKLDRENEEGFVLVFWRTEDDVYPQRVKVKLESYLKLCKPNLARNLESLCSTTYKDGRPKHPVGPPTIYEPPSPTVLLNTYTIHRKTIPSFIRASVDKSMSHHKQKLLNDIRDLNVSDDYGGEPWIEEMASVWDRIHVLFSVQEEKWKEAVSRLGDEGFTTSGSRKMAKQRCQTVMRKFEMRIGDRDVDGTLVPSLMAWFEGKSTLEILHLVIENMKIPHDFKSTDTVVLE